LVLVNEPMTPPSVDGLLTFFYYKDFKKAGDFYENIMGFKMVQDQKWAKIFQVAEKTFMGCVDGNIGYHKASETKP
jgi:hypothetical protein